MSDSEPGPVDPIEAIWEQYGTKPVMPCELCGALMDLVPPANFWYACRSCHPKTFVRD